MHGPGRVRLAALCALLVLPAGVWASDEGRERGAPVSCPVDVTAAITQLCPCDGFATHGQYVRCLAHFARALRRARCPGEVSRTAFRCATWSTCGKPAAVVCCTSTFGARHGQAGETAVARMTFRGRLSHDAAACTAAGGTPMGAGSVCTACATSTTTTSTTTSTTSSTTTTTTTSTSTTTLATGGTYGNAVAFPGASTNFANYLLGVPLTIPVQSVLTHLCVIAKAGGPNVMLALYSDNAGYPDQLVAATPTTPMTVGAMEIPVTPTSVATGTYWLMGVYDTDASIGFDQSDPTALVEYASHAFASPLPNPFGGATPYSGQQFNYYVRVQ